MSCYLRDALLVPVELLEGHHGQKDIVLLKAKEAGWVVHEYIGIKHKELLLTRRVGGACLPPCE
jgi:hypothetical protein